MIENNTLALAKNYLHLNTDESSFSIGKVTIADNDDMLIEIAERYYNHINYILQTTEKEFETSKELFDYAFKRDVINTIKKRFFPRYSDFNMMFQNKNNYRNENLSELSFWANNDQDRESLIAGYKASKELYGQFVRSRFAPEALKELISSTVPVLLSSHDIHTHSFIVSKTDTGKSTLILELAKNIIDKGESSLVIFEPHGDLSQEIAKLTPKENLVYLDPLANSEYSPTINIFDVQDINPDSISKYTSLIVNTFKQIVGSEFTNNMHTLITPIISVLLQIPNTSFYDMLRFLNDEQNKELIEFGKNNALIPSHRLFFQTQFSQSRYSSTKFSIASKLNILLQDSIFSNLLTGKSTIDLEEMINTKGKVIVVKLNTIDMIETIEPIGRFLIAQIVAYAFQRGKIKKQDRVPCHLFIDEAKMFIGDSIEIILEQARKFHLYLLLAIQNNSQLPHKILSSVLSNTAIKFVGINSYKNHSIMSHEMGVSIDDLETLKLKGEFFIKIGNNKAFKFRVSDRLFDKQLYHSDYEFNKIIKEQIKNYYRKINLSNIEYAEVEFESIEYKKPYSKESTQELLSELQNNDNTLLDY
ncbi:type IV secretory system conjugative DNA transfer family protein [Sulfurimonas sp.]|uniref:type IV secretory system conjugative DNA transfer family protein n=1 Tax=Sulfurimonas sp. TaxID=2022749 RepID=UPI003D0B7C78